MKNRIDKLINSPRFTNPNIKALVTMLYVGNLLNYEIDKVTRQKFSLTIQQYNALGIMGLNTKENLPAMKAAEIKSRMTFKDSDISRLLQRLAKKGLVTLYRDKKDKRVLMARLTEKGTTLLKEIEKNEDELFRAVSLLTNQEAEQMNFLFDKVLQAYEN